MEIVIVVLMAVTISLTLKVILDSLIDNWFNWPVAIRERRDGSNLYFYYRGTPRATYEIKWKPIADRGCYV